MHTLKYLAEGYHVDEVGNLIASAFVDLREPVDRSPVGTLRKASTRRHAIRENGTIRISKPLCLLIGKGERGAMYVEEDAVHRNTGIEAVDEAYGLSVTGVHRDAGNDRSGSVGARAPTEIVRTERSETTASGAGYSANAWVYCASVEPETEEERVAWWKAMPGERAAYTTIRRPREFARALGGMVAEQVGPRGRVVRLRNTLDGHVSCTEHRCQTVYHGPVVYSEEPGKRLESALSELELMLLPIFMKPAAHRAQREYRFAVWAEEELKEDHLDLEVSAALIDAVQRPRKASDGRGCMSAGLAESSVVEEGLGGSRTGVRVEALSDGSRSPIVRPRRYDERLPDDLREAVTNYAAVDALREVVAGSDAGCRADVAAAAWHADPLVRFLCSTFGDSIVCVRVTEEDFIAFTARFSGDVLIEAGIAVGPEGTCACKISAGDMHLASTAPDVRSFLDILKNRLSEVGVVGKGGRVRR